MKKKGFTLIELLAVIVILAIIALIATPLVLKYIEYSKEGSAKLSANTYAEAVEKEYVSKLTSNEKMDNKSYSISELEEIGVKVKGDKPEGTNDYVVLNNGNVIEYALTIKGYIITYKDGNTTVESEKDSNSNSKKIDALDYTVTFIVDGEPYQIITVTDGQSINAPSTPVKQGYYFSGWKGENDTIQTFPIIPTDDATFTAILEESLADSLYAFYNVDKEVYKYCMVYLFNDNKYAQVFFSTGVAGNKFYSGYRQCAAVGIDVEPTNISGIVSSIITKGSPNYTQWNSASTIPSGEYVYTNFGVGNLLK